MSSVLHRRLGTGDLRLLVGGAPATGADLTGEHRRMLSERLRELNTGHRQRIDAWSVEQGGRPPTGFSWSARTARRQLARLAIGETLRARSPLRPSLNVVVDSLIATVQRGEATPWSLARWLEMLPGGARALVIDEALSWATEVVDVAQQLGAPWRPATSDSFFDVAQSSITLCGRRDLVVHHATGPVVIRLRGGSPSKSAAHGLRTDLLIATLAHCDDRPPRRLIGVWPEAGLILAVDSTMDELRSGARDVVRCAVVRARTNVAEVA